MKRLNPKLLPRVGRTSVVLSATMALAACATMSAPERDSYAQAKTQVQGLESEPLASEAAGTPLQRARQDLANADYAVAHHNPDAVMYWSYLARREAQTGQAMVDELQARNRMASATAVREQMLLSYQRRRAEFAQQRAALAEERATQAEAALQQLQQQNAQAQEQAQVDQARQEAQQAEQASEQAQQEAAQQAASAQQQAQQQVAQVQQQAAQQAATDQQQVAQAQQQAAAQAASSQQQVAQAQQQAAAQAASSQQQLAQAQQQADQARQKEDQARQELANLQAHQTSQGMLLTLSNSLLFATNRDVIEPGALPTINNVAEFLQQHPGVKIRIEGFTDDRGSDQLNDALSQRRAQAVANAFEADGVDSSRFVVIGRGASLPLASNGNAAGRQQNRRVEMLFSDTTGRFASNEAGQALR